MDMEFATNGDLYMLEKGINPCSVAANIDYLAKGFDKRAIAQGHLSADALAKDTKGKNLMDASDCVICHKKEKKSIFPGYRAIATKYKMEAATFDNLSKKIINADGGVWGETSMAGLPQIKNADANEDNLTGKLMVIFKATATRIQETKSGG